MPAAQPCRWISTRGRDSTSTRTTSGSSSNSSSHSSAGVQPAHPQRASKSTSSKSSRKSKQRRQQESTRSHSHRSYRSLATLPRSSSNSHSSSIAARGDHDHLSSSQTISRASLGECCATSRRRHGKRLHGRSGRRRPLPPAKLKQKARSRRL